MTSPTDQNIMDSLRKEIWSIVKKDSLASSRIGFPSYTTITAIDTFLTSQRTLLLEKVLEKVVGENIEGKQVEGSSVAKYYVNKLKAEQRQALLELKEGK